MQTTVDFIEINPYHCMQHTTKPERKHFDQQQEHTLTQSYELTTGFGDVTAQLVLWMLTTGRRLVLFSLHLLIM